MLTSEQADILVDLIEAGSDGNYPNMIARCREIGWTDEQVEEAGQVLADLAGRDNPVEDFGE